MILYTIDSVRSVFSSVISAGRGQLYNVIYEPNKRLQNVRVILSKDHSQSYLSKIVFDKTSYSLKRRGVYFIPNIRRDSYTS
jgi:hypothetical protein